MQLMFYFSKQAGVSLSTVAIIATECHAVIISYQWFLVGIRHFRDIRDFLRLSLSLFRLIGRHQKRYFLVVMSLLSNILSLLEISSWFLDCGIIPGKFL